VERAQFTAEVAGGSLVGSVAGEGRQVLLLHGGPGLSIGYLDDLLPELDGMRVATYQQRGLAPSTAREPYDVGVQVSDVVAVLDALGWERPLVLGHSWGGHLLLHLLASRPDRVAAAVVVDPVGCVGDGGQAEFEAEMGRRTPPSALARALEIEQREEAGLATEAELQESLRLFWPAYFADPASAAPRPETQISSEAFLQTLASLDGTLPELAERLRGCAVPTRFVHGALSPMPVTASTDSAALWAAAEVDVVPGAGHFIWLEAPGAVRRSLDLLG